MYLSNATCAATPRYRRQKTMTHDTHVGSFYNMVTCCHDCYRVYLYKDRQRMMSKTRPPVGLCKLKLLQVESSWPIAPIKEKLLVSIIEARDKVTKLLVSNYQLVPLHPGE
jgi:hypothetical protein